LTSIQPVSFSKTSRLATVTLKFSRRENHSVKSQNRKPFPALVLASLPGDDLVFRLKDGGKYANING
jgi:hypothetical protein